MMMEQLHLVPLFLMLKQHSNITMASSSKIVLLSRTTLGHSNFSTGSNYFFFPMIFFLIRDGSSVFVSYYDPDRVGDYPTADPSEDDDSTRHHGNGFSHNGDSNSTTSDIVRTKSDIERGDVPVQLKTLKDLGTANPMQHLHDDGEGHEDD